MVATFGKRVGMAGPRVGVWVKGVLGRPVVRQAGLGRHFRGAERAVGFTENRNSLPFLGHAPL